MAFALVIDDSQQNADSLCQMLGFLGLTARPAYGPRAAMLELSSSTPDIVFLDISMPGVDGFEVLAYLRRIPEMASLPVVMVTSDDQPETRQRAVRGGAVDLIIKPTTFEALEIVLKKTGVI